MKLQVFATEHRITDTMDIVSRFRADRTESHDIFLGNS